MGIYLPVTVDKLKLMQLYSITDKYLGSFCKNFARIIQDHAFLHDHAKLLIDNVRYARISETLAG